MCPIFIKNLYCGRQVRVGGGARGAGHRQNNPSLLFIIYAYLLLSSPNLSSHQFHPISPFFLYATDISRESVATRETVIGI